MSAGARLPPEIIAHIVEYYNVEHRWTNRQSLAGLCLVSRAWRDIAQPHLWTHVERVERHRQWAKKVEEFKFHSALAANPQLGRLVKTLRYYSYDPKDTGFFKTVANFCPNLKRLEVWTWRSTLSNQDLYELASKCGHLEGLHIAKCSQITEDGWISAAPFLKKLRTLSVSQLPNFKDKAVCAIVDACRLLDYLAFNHTNVTCDGVSYVMLNATKLVTLDVGFFDSVWIDREEIETMWLEHPARLDFDLEFCEDSTRMCFTLKKDARSQKQTQTLSQLS
ncbi:hypothetical protein DFS34DRAFT_667762 [Phlyctochytrium arcticum]|nr:hypothetical protein DFS34DRAFT_667762 [Phlyctochytrium arcticum]